VLLQYVIDVHAEIGSRLRAPGRNLSICRPFRNPERYVLLCAFPLQTTMTVFPIGVSATRRERSEVFLTFFAIEMGDDIAPLNTRAVSGSPASTFDTKTPVVSLRPRVSAVSGVMLCSVKPTQPRMTVPVSFSCEVISLAVFDGNGEADTLSGSNDCGIYAYYSPLRLSRGPPLLPGLIGASVCRSCHTDLRRLPCLLR